jgi:hypothetical protein
VEWQHVRGEELDPNDNESLYHSVEDSNDDCVAELRLAGSYPFTPTMNQITLADLCLRLPPQRIRAGGKNLAISAPAPPCDALHYPFRSAQSRQASSSFVWR